MQKFELAIGEPPHQISGAVDPLLDIEIGCERDESRFGQLGVISISFGEAIATDVKLARAAVFDNFAVVADNKEAHLRRLRRIEGQVRGLQRMIDEDKYCIDILTQISAATRALQAVSLSLLDEHLRHCVTDAIAEGGSNADEKIKEAGDAIARLVRS